MLMARDHPTKDGEYKCATVSHNVCCRCRRDGRDVNCASLYIMRAGVSRLVFHRPPFNSVNHLHMHCIALPLRPGRTWMKHDSLFFWTILAEQQLAKLVAEHQKASKAAP